MMIADRGKNNMPGRAVTVAEAAAHYGVSTLRIRHRLRTGALSGFHDNRNHWQVHLDTADIATSDRPLDRDALADMLVEELLEAKDRIDDQDQTIARLQALVDRQQRLLDRTVTRLESLPASPPDSALVGRLQKALDRALALLEAVAPRVDAAEARSDRLGRTLKQALALGDQAIRRAETAANHATRLDAIVERALGEAEERKKTQESAELRLVRRDQLLDRALGLVERAALRLAGDAPHGEGGMIDSVRRVVSLWGRNPRRPASG
jgi:hypothetical protein